MVIGVLALCAGLTIQARPALAQTKTCSAMKPFDPDNDGTLDLNEAKTDASRLFERIDRDKDGTVFTAADPKNDGTIDCTELGRPGGEALMKLLK
jgi:Ca2+-binding EF-hand superfamily protein